MASPSSVVFCILLSLSLFSIVSATWVKIDRWNIPSEAEYCSFARPDSSTLLKIGKCLPFNNYAVTASFDDGFIVVGNCTNSYCSSCTYTYHTERECDAVNGISVTTDNSLPFTQYYAYTTVFYTGAMCSDIPVGAYLDNNNYNSSCYLPSGTPCNNIYNTKEFCTIPEDLFVTPKGPNFSQKFNPDANFVVASGYPSDDCGGEATVEVIQQVENCMVSSSSSGFFKVENGKLFYYDCDDKVCGTCTSIQLAEKQCQFDEIDKRSTTGDNILASVFRPITDRRQKREIESDNPFDLANEVQSIQFEVVKKFPKKLAKNKFIVVNYVAMECSGDINMMMFQSGKCLGMCLLGIEFSCNIDDLLDRIAPGWDKGLSTIAIAAIVVAVIVVVGGVVGIVIYKKSHKRGDQGRSYFSQAENSEAFPDQK